MNKKIEIHLDKNFIGRIDTWMEKTGRARSLPDAVLQLVDIGLGKITGENVQLSDGDKLNFMILRDIVKHFKIRNAETKVDLVADAIYGGHYWAPIWEMRYLFHNHADCSEEVSLVVDTLDMWSFIEVGIDKLSPQEREEIKEANHGYLPQFEGFDSHDEGSLMSITRFLVENMGRFSHFKKRDFDSHAPNAARYRRMATAFKPIRATLDFNRNLKVEQIIELLKGT